MTKKLTCIECPEGCVLLADVEGEKVIKVKNAKCPRGEKYALSEIENPVRVLTSTVATEGLELKMIPVRTDKAIPKRYILSAAKEIRRIRVKSPVSAGDVIAENFAGSGANLIATRSCKK